MGTISPTLAVRNMKKTIEFYRDNLGFKVGMVFPDVDNPQYADLSRDGMILMFLPAKNVGIGPKQKLGIGVNLYMEVDGDIDEYYEELKNKQVNITSEIKNEPFGIRDFTIEDLDGYQLTFNQASKFVKTCMSCGMPMANPEDYGAGDTSNVYCVYCTNSDGKLKSRDKVFEGMIDFMMTTQKMDRTTAEDTAREHMSKMPAWS